MCWLGCQRAQWQCGLGLMQAPWLGVTCLWPVGEGCVQTELWLLECLPAWVGCGLKQNLNFRSGFFPVVILRTSVLLQKAYWGTPTLLVLAVARLDSWGWVWNWARTYRLYKVTLILSWQFSMTSSAWTTRQLSGELGTFVGKSIRLRALWGSG